jgi:hypothetical protein
MLATIQYKTIILSVMEEHRLKVFEKRNAYRILVGMREEKRPLGRPRHRWVDDSKMDLREMGWGGMD